MIARVSTPVGWLEVRSQDGAVTAVTWVDGPAPPADRDGAADDVAMAACAELAAWFDGRRRAFSVPVRIEGSDFLQRVCAAIQAIPYGEVRRYGELAGALGVPARPVGGACGRNPVPIIVPCHRVVGAGGRLTGYSGGGGLATKSFLLALESRHRRLL